MLQGLVRSIGVSNFSIQKMQMLLADAQVPLSVCQVASLTFNYISQVRLAGYMYQTEQLTLRSKGC